MMFKNQQPIVIMLHSSTVENTMPSILGKKHMTNLVVYSYPYFYNTIITPP